MNNPKTTIRTQIRNSCGTLGCALQYDKNTWFAAGIPCDYQADTAAYAAFRFIRHCPQLRDRLIPEAVALGLRSGKAARPLRRRVRLPAERLSLPGKTAVVYLSVSQGLVSIRGVRIG